MTTTSSTGNSLALDVKDLSSLRKSAQQGSPDALRESAKKFEGMFVNMMIKSMRDATPKDGLFDSEQGKMFTSMLDQELSQTMAKRGVGLADALVRQLSSNAEKSNVSPAGLVSNEKADKAKIAGPKKLIDPVA